MTTIYDLGLLDHFLYIKLIFLRSDKTKLIPLHKLSFSNNSAEEILFCLSELSSINKVISFDLMGIDSSGNIIEYPIEYFNLTPNRYSEDVYNIADRLTNNEELIDKKELQIGISIKDQSKLEEDINKGVTDFKMNLLDRGELDRQYYSFQLQEKALSEILLKISQDLKTFKFPISLSKIEDKKIDVLRTLLALESDKKISIHNIWNKRKSWLVKPKQNNEDKLQDKDDICIEVEVLEKLQSQSPTASVKLSIKGQEDNAKNQNINERVLTTDELILDLEKTILQYKKNESLEIEPDSKPVKFLVLLMTNPDKLIEYTEIAKRVELNCYHEGVSNKDVATEVNYVRRDLVSILEKAGMTKEEINILIIAKKNIGYKLVTISQKLKVTQ